MDALSIRRLDEADAERYSELRLQALVEHPEAFGSSPEEHPHLEQIRARFRGRWGSADSHPLGAFVAGELVGLCQLSREGYAKGAHKGVITQMYVRPEQRSRGVGRALLVEAITRGRAMGLEQLQLAVVTANEDAIGLYRDLGFRTWGIEWNAIRVNGRYYHEAWMGLDLTR